MLNFFKNLFDDNAREVKKLQRVVEEINGLEEKIAKLTDEELQGKTAEFKQLLENGKTLNDILPEAFAVCREASKRVLGMRHYDVQLIGGMVLHQGRIAEMRTGEGKTLVATLPVYLNALSGKGVHVITVNDYLATRDSEWMGKLYRFLGLSVGLIVHGIKPEDRRLAYNADITYGTNNEFGFDYLRDNMSLHPEQLVQRELNYSIVDEVDSILIDEARTPLIISGVADKPTHLYYTMAKIVPKLVREVDYTVDEKAHNVLLTEEGVSKAEKLLGIENLYDEANMEINHHLNQSLKAHGLMHRDRDYVVRDGEVVIVDEFTGRLMFGRRYSDGLHQAIEAKEGVKIEKESQTLATITFQNYFRMYNKIAGMTGTALTEEEEFRKIYGLDVVVIPTNKPTIRKDLADLVYKTEMAKFRAVVEDVVQRHETGQPVLVGTISIAKSELLSSLLKRRGVPHQVLNAKHHDKEAEIIAQAGRFKAVTIATNMAGRGTDILLGGNPEVFARAEMRKKGITEENAPAEYQQIVEKYMALCNEERAKVMEKGGLHIIGTERHESRRIDNQLRGRAGRQGDPGSSQFYIALEDDLMRLFGSDNIAGLMDRLGMEEDVPIENALITKSIETAQKRVESRNFSIRKHVLDYDDVMNQQREVIYAQRRKVLTGHNLAENIKDTITAVVERSVDMYCPEGVHEEEWDLAGLLEYAEGLYMPNHNIEPAELEEMGRQGLKDELLERTMSLYQKREEELGAETLREIERIVLLRLVDEKWMDHLDAMDQLREGIGLRAYGSKDPVIEYKFEAYEMFNNMIANIQDDVVRYIFRVNVAAPQERTQRQVVENRYAEEEGKQPIRKENQIGRNDDCPCGSGKKYKKCCGKNA
ncbi:protein translocase subunit secA [Desulforamulus reducens MI-1]|uniref:Protein translocase subunit SecA n=1 Tax=Desulforamulus reducens (strain ATCC BAA-1160 / DSM 100696 / MI-1) TaxID=349161 RepID=SECA_DESRM|nr:preprotein translocase subunit SecA [Desulforamulus reducens]A4J927.1 RecName: Full=Protein translocase subunit SecA [Desulforamulus reducens MI-1]ABO51580.1 protein translocase subunit secA [Desulforamulus reducens MI-1]